MVLLLFELQCLMDFLPHRISVSETVNVCHSSYTNWSEMTGDEEFPSSSSFFLQSCSPSTCLCFSDGPDLLEGHGANRDGAHWVSGGLTVPVPAQHHDRRLHRLPGRRVLHHLGAHLLPLPVHPRLEGRRAPLQVRDLCFNKELLSVDPAASAENVPMI